MYRRSKSYKIFDCRKVSTSILARYPSLGGGQKEGGDGDAAPPVLGADASAVGPGLPPEADDYFKVCACARFFFVLCVFF